MPQVRAEFNYQPSADAQRYEIFYGTQRLGFSDTLQFTTDLELEYGTHNFSVRGVNIDGTGPFRSTQVVLEEPYVPLPTPGPIGALEVSLVILGGGVGGGEPPVEPPVVGSNLERITAAFNGVVVPFAYDIPADPITTQTITVTTQSQLNGAAATSGARIVIRGPGNGGASSYSLTIDDADQWFELDNDATITSLSISRVNGQIRTRFTGGFITLASALTPNGMADFLFDNVNITVTADAAIVNVQGGGVINRYAMLNSTIDAGSYAWFCAPQESDSDIIHANNDLRGGNTIDEAVFRSMSTSNSILVNGRHRTGAATTKHNVRFHGVASNILVEGMQFEVDGSATQFDPTAGGTYYGPLTDIYVRNNDYYKLDGGFMLEVQHGGVNNIEVSNNRSYKDSGSFNISNTGSTGSATGTNFFDNTRLPTQSPPAFSGGADH